MRDTTIYSIYGLLFKKNNDRQKLHKKIMIKK